MDNHRAAMWCWLQEIPESEAVGLFHLDEHYDTLDSQLDAWLAALPELRGLSIEEYLALAYEPAATQQSPIIRWDNYLSLFLERYSSQVVQAHFVTHDVGDKPRCAFFGHPAWEVPENLTFWLESLRNRWIINVDLDYFFCCDGEGKRRRMFSDEYIKSVFGSIRKLLDSDRVACLTICLTPDEEYTGGWPQAEKLCAEVCSTLALDFVLP